MNLTIEQLNNDLEWNVEVWSFEDVQRIFTSVNSESYLTLDELRDDIHNDYNYIYDVKLSSIIDTLTYNGFSKDTILEKLNNHYQDNIEIYYLKGNEMFAAVLL